MDELVLELPARRRDVRIRRRQPVAAHHQEREDVAEPAGADRIARGAVPGVEAALEADLKLSLGALDVRDDVSCFWDADRDRLLAERRDARVEALLDERGVRVRRRDDDRGVDALQGVVDARGRLRFQRAGDLLRAGRVGVVHAQLIHVLRFAQDLRVERAETADTKDGDTHGEHSAMERAAPSESSW